MIFGSAAWGFRETPLEKQLEITKRLGFETLELGIANAPRDVPLDVSDEEIKRVKALYDNYNVKLICAATGNDFTCGNDNDVKKIKSVIDICEKLGAKYLRIFAGFSPKNDVTGTKWDNMINRINQVLDFAKNVVPVIETHGGVNGFSDGVEHFKSVSTSADTLLKIPDIKLLFDPANLFAVGENPLTVYEKIKDRVAVVHLKDFITLRSGHLKPAACGESKMKWKPIIDAMRDKDYPMLFEYENTEDIEQGLKKSYDYIKEMFK